jgi:hypothetical protein
MAGIMLKRHSIDSSIASLIFVVRKNVITSFWGALHVSLPKGKMKFESKPDIPEIAGDGLAYFVACLQFLDSS